MANNLMRAPLPPPVPQRNNNFNQPAIATRPLPPPPPVPAAFNNRQPISNQNAPMPLGPKPPMPLGPKPPMPLGPRPSAAFNQTRQFPQPGFNNQAPNPFAQQTNAQSSYNVQANGPYYSNYDFDENLDYSDSQYIKDLKTLNEFYEQNKYGPILEKRYYDYDLEWTPPQITIPLNELYERLKYYDDLMSFESLSPEQVIEAKEQSKKIIDQIISYDNYEFYKNNGYERLSYNDDCVQDYNEIAFRNVKYYQREDGLDCWGNDLNYVPISLPKNKWWMTQPFCFPEDESYFVKFISENRYPNELLLHPMFTYLNEYGSFQDLSNEPIIDQSPTLQTSYEQTPVTNTNVRTDDEQETTKSKKWYSKLFKSKKEKKMDAKIEHKNFPKKENPPPPQPTIMPPKHNPPPPQPTIMPPKPKTPQPPQPGKGFGPNLNSQQAYFNYQQK